MSLALFVLNTIASSELLSHRQRMAIYRRFGLDAPATAYIEPRCYFTQTDLRRVKLGERAYIGVGCYIDNSAVIFIDSDTCIAAHSKILTTTHRIGPSERRVGNSAIRQDVFISQGCWLGAGTTVLPGVVIGDGVVVGASATVTKRLERDAVYVGVPALLMRRLGTIESSTPIRQ